MRYEIRCRPSHSLVELHLEAGETIVADAGAMAWMTEGIDTETSSRGGVMAGLGRKVLGGESFFQNTYRATSKGGVIGLAPGPAGDVVARELAGEELFVSRGGYLASGEGIAVDTRFQGLAGLFNAGLFALRCHGSGPLFLAACGAVSEVDVDGDYLIDNGYVVAWEPSLSWKLTRARRIRSFLFSDQILLRFSGTGKLWVQSRSPQGLANFMHPFRPRKSRSS